MQDQSQRCGDVAFHAFDPVIVQLSLDRSNVQHEKLVLKLVSPFIEGFSIQQQPQEDVEMDNTVEPEQNRSTKAENDGQKRKENKQQQNQKKKKKK